MACILLTYNLEVMVLELETNCIFRFPHLSSSLAFNPKIASSSSKHNLKMFSLTWRPIQTRQSPAPHTEVLHNNLLKMTRHIISNSLS